MATNSKWLIEKGDVGARKDCSLSIGVAGFKFLALSLNSNSQSMTVFFSANANMLFSNFLILSWVKSKLKYA